MLPAKSYFHNYVEIDVFLCNVRYGYFSFVFFPVMLSILPFAGVITSAIVCSPKVEEYRSAYQTAMLFCVALATADAIMTFYW